MRKGRIYRELASMKSDLNFIKEYVLLKEISPDVLNLLRDKVCFDTGSSGLNWKNNELVRQPMYDSIANEFNKKIVSLKIMELTPYLLANADKKVDEILRYIRLLKVEDKNGAYFALLHKVREIFMLFDGVADKICEQMDDDLKSDYSCPYNHLFSVSYSLMKKDRQKALRKLKDYVNNCGLNEIHKFVAVADYAYGLGYRNRLIKKSALMYKNIQKTTEEQFVNKIKNSNVCVVGNGPQEIGSLNGKIIDSYDEVIRFNEFNQFISNFKEGYGTKTTICAETNDYCDKYLPGTQFRVLRRNCYVQELVNFSDYEKIMDNKHDFYCIDDKIYKEIYDKYGIIMPTTGFLLLYIVKKIKGDSFGKKDIFGFSFKNFDDDGSTHYNDGKTLNGHDMDMEMKILAELFKK